MGTELKGATLANMGDNIQLFSGKRMRTIIVVEVTVKNIL
jgi:hypothetical protein